MNLDFQREYWESSLQYPDWYKRLEKELRQLFFPVVHNDARLKAFRNKVYDLIEELLAGDKIPLAESGPDLDRNRQPVDTVVIHHTEEDPGMSLGKLSAIGLVRQYGFEYLEKDISGDRVGGKPVWSGHFREGKMVFFAYHWLIRPDGRAERLLEDAYIGWHAGNWDTNTRSTGAPARERIFLLTGKKLSYGGYNWSDTTVIGLPDMHRPVIACRGNT